MTTPKTFTRLDDILNANRAALGADHLAYRNHCQRVANIALQLLGPGDWDDKLAITAAHHDIGIWTAGTWDYLAPSVAAARTYLAAQNLAAWGDEIAAAIENHHKLTPCAPGASPLPEAFRRADLTDVSLGMIRHGVEAGFVRALKALFPNAGFHRRLLELSGAWFVRHPLNPMPMMKV